MDARRRLRDRLRIALLVVGLAATACTRGPQPIAFDSDTCDYCRMQISDPRFGAELVTRKGKVLKFDSVECLVDYYRQARAASDVASLWVIDITHPGKLIPAESARYLKLRPGMSPMGRALAAAAPDVDAGRLRELGATAQLSWGDVQ